MEDPDSRPLELLPADDGSGDDKGRRAHKKPRQRARANTFGSITRGPFDKDPWGQWRKEGKEVSEAEVAQWFAELASRSVPLTTENLNKIWEEIDVAEQYGQRQAAKTGGAEIWDFKEVGDKHEGVYKGTKVLDPQYKELFVIGDKLVKNTRQTADAIEPLPVGAYVWLEFRGKVAIKGGKTVNSFNIEFALPAEKVSKDQPDTEEEAF